MKNSFWCAPPVPKYDEGFNDEVTTCPELGSVKLQNHKIGQNQQKINSNIALIYHRLAREYMKVTEASGSVYEIHHYWTIAASSAHTCDCEEASYDKLLEVEKTSLGSCSWVVNLECECKLEMMCDCNTLLLRDGPERQSQGIILPVSRVRSSASVFTLYTERNVTCV